jgi:long-chain acyl-CoA synthetase
MSVIFDKVKDNAKLFPNKVAVIQDDGKALSYEQLVELVKRQIIFLQNKINFCGCRVAFCFRENINIPITTLSLNVLRATLIPLNPNLKYKQLSLFLSSVDADILLVDSSTEDLFEKMRSEILVINVDSLKESSKISVNPSRNDVEDTEYNQFLITFSSGSTGDPKPILFSEKNKIERAQQAMELFGINQDDVVLCASPFFHSLGQRLTLLPLLAGGTLVQLAYFNAKRWVDAVTKYKVTFTIPVSTHLHLLVDQIIKFPEKVETLRSIVSSSATIDKSVKLELFKKLNCNFYEMYGASEVATATSLNNYQAIEKSNSVGLPCPGVEIRIVNHKFIDCRPMEIGKIIIKSPLVSQGYYKLEKITKKSFFNDFFITGDLGYLDVDGYLYFVNREKDLIISGGVNIYPSDIESYINSNKYVDICVVVGVKDLYLGEVVIAVVVSKDDDKVMVENNIRAVLRKELLPNQQPIKYFFESELPYSPSGKIDRKLIQKKLNELELDLTKTLRKIKSL